jgi:2-oxoglutarate ferredoxin oxidoreductase subunit delta
MDKPEAIYEVKISKDKCKGCQFCVFYCPVKHLEMSKELNKRGVKFAKTKKETKCIGCGFCFLMCPDSCIEVYEE